jgi:hypothetical protein
LPPESKSLAHPFAPAISATPRQGRLGPHRARSDPDSRPDGFEPSPTRGASGQLLHPTLSKMSTRAPRGYRLARSSSMRPVASRHWPRFGRLTWYGSDAVDARRTLFRDRPVTPASPVEFSSTGAGFLFRPMPLPLPPRERQPFPRHRTPPASKQPFSGPLVSPRVATGLVLSTPFHSRLPFFAGLPP